MKNRETEIDSPEIKERGDHRKMLGWTVPYTHG